MMPMRLNYNGSTLNTLVSNRAVTHPSLHIRDAHDAHVVLEAVRLNILPLIRRRLVASEREQLTSGNVFVWEEAEDDGGLLRWTDGRRWSQSRMRGDYLFYEEKVETTQEEKDAKAARRARRASDPTAVVPPPTRRKDRPAKPDGLTKQTYSAVVHLPGTKEIRKWHVVAYFSGNDYTRLPVIEHFDYLRNIRVPDGVFMSSKSVAARMDRLSYYSDETETPEYETPTGPSPFYSPPVPSSSGGQMHAPIPYPPPLSPPILVGDRTQRIALPPLATLGHSQYPLPAQCRPPDTSSPFTPISSEDRRVLDRFRIAL